MSDVTVASAADWWSKLYAPASPDTLSAAPAAVGGAGAGPAGGGRLPDWRAGEVVDLSKPADAKPADADADDVDPEDPVEESDDADDAEEFDDDPDEESDDDSGDSGDSGDASRQRAPRRPLREYLTDHGDQERRFRRLVYNSTAAGAGWCLGLVGEADGLLHECGASTGDSVAALILGAGFVAAALMLVDRRTRGWYAPLAWVCRIPLASAALALALFTPHIVL